MEPDSFFQKEIEAELKYVQSFQIHGAKFVEFGFSFSSDPKNSMRRARVSSNLIYPDVKPGDRVKIAFLMGNVSLVSKAD
jgi:hypothetical protein